MVHDALFYRDPDEFVAGVSTFVQAGWAHGEPALIAVPSPKIPVLRSRLDDDQAPIEFIDINELGRNPSRIIPAIRDFFDRQDAPRCRVVGEPIWPGRSPCEMVEATRHEALLNVAFADAAVTILCPYETSGLGPAVLDDAQRTHPHVIRDQCRSPSCHYEDPLTVWAAAKWSLPEPVPPVATVTIEADLGPLRAFAAAGAREAGLSQAQVSDFVLAANEAATNALIYGDDGGELRIWRDGGRLVCEISTGGALEDPLAGRWRPAPDSPRGRGLWMINQLCDLVELRSGDSGTTIRLHVKLDRAAAGSG